MRAVFPTSLLLFAAAVMLGTAEDGHAASSDAKSKERCADFGFTQGTESFANCVMHLALTQEAQQPDRDALIRHFRSRSIARRGDDRYPVCSAGMMDNELDISTGKWVGPDCQMAPD